MAKCSELLKILGNTRSVSAEVCLSGLGKIALFLVAFLVRSLTQFAKPRRVGHLTSDDGYSSDFSEA
ncbi:hypothetical protein EWB00_004063 [Schistosoma japonicum]|uniref:Uncharacterized protein n=1 Tax=Schistosoma japonicum TaxID=6182 RepID=A0A4Z2D6Q0_SCHJA|nr:hypothetical protein EWB00_004063 [Schistosoma japonicum]